MTLKETKTKTIKVKNCSLTPTWSSEDTSVATVDENGNVTIIGSGKATITAYIGEGKKAKKYKSTVTVKDSENAPD